MKHGLVGLTLRQRIYRRLRRAGELSGSQLTAELRRPADSVRAQLNVLVEAEVVEKHGSGRNLTYRVREGRK